MASDAPPFALRQSKQTADAALCESGKGRMHIARTHVVFLTADAHVGGRVRDQLGLLGIRRYERIGGGRQDAQIWLESLSPAPRSTARCTTRPCWTTTSSAEPAPTVGAATAAERW